ncbi:hypothetical protein AB833_08590 [Chromatiales bacterium (ex Bugula neritina AB1)]|nr:hypothetical protein AB833_08590 [Chromatiales bacterium (ex Bugula neritina AB1)]
MKDILLWFHLAAGSLAVIGLLIAWLSAKGQKWHRRGGKMYVYTMAVALVMATVMSVVTSNIFLLLIGLFSGYQIYTGWRSANVRNGVTATVDRAASAAMLLTSVVMAATGLWMLSTGKNLGTVLIIFAAIGGIPAWLDWKRNAWPKGKDRIVLHLTRMGGGSIATLTAVFVVNVDTNPAFVAWILPSIFLTPVIIYFIRRQKGKTRLKPFK